MSSLPLALEVHGVSKRFPGVRALHSVDLDVRYGEVHVLVGENGAGKSTLMKIIYGATRADSGEIRWNGAAVDVRNPHEARQLGISIDEQSGSHQRSGLEFTPALARGDSGAPIVDGEGKVAGVAFATNDTVGYASATSELRALEARSCPQP